MRLIKVIAGGAMVVLLVTLLTRPHPSARKATEFYKKAADQANAVAQSNLGLRYATGQGVPKDLGKATELYQKATDQGYAGAQNNLGVLYATGRGVPKDSGKAAELFQKAADQGDQFATTLLKRLSGEND